MKSATTPDKPGAARRTVGKRIVKVLGLSILAVVLFVVGSFELIYSSWFQDTLRQRLVASLNATPDTEFRLGQLDIDFPLNVTVGDLLMVSHGDTLVRAGHLNADMELLPLLKGNVRLNGATLSDGRFQAGALDSASRVIITAADMRIQRTNVRLSDMDIHVSAVNIDNGLVDLYINPCDTFPRTPDTPPTRMAVTVDTVIYNNLTFGMNLMPTIKSLTANIAHGGIGGTRVDMFNQTVDVADFTGHGMDIRYIMPDSAQIAATKVVEGLPSDSPPWTVRVARMSMDDSRALYTTHGVIPQPGLDFEYIAADKLTLQVDSFYNCEAVVRVPFRLTGHERSGLQPDISGLLAIDANGLTFTGFNISTPVGTDFVFDGYMGTEAELTTPDVPLRLDVDGDISVADIGTMMPTLRPTLDGLRAGSLIDADIAVSGLTGNLNMNRVNLLVDNHIDLHASGVLKNIFADSGLSGRLDFGGYVTDVSGVVGAMLADAGLRIPSMRLNGKATFDNGDYIADLKAVTNGGSVALDGAFYGNSTEYNVDVRADNLPVDAFLPTMDVGRLTATISANGHGFDFAKTSTSLSADLDIPLLQYRESTYRDITLSADLADGRAEIDFDSRNPGLEASLTLDGTLSADRYVFTAALNSRNVDLSALGLSQTPADMMADLSLDVDMTPDLRDVDATLKVSGLQYITPQSSLSVDDARIMVNATDSVTNIAARNRDMYAYYSSPLPLDSVMGRVKRVQNTLAQQFNDRHIDVEVLQQAIMPFRIDIDAGNENALASMLAQSEISFGHATILASNDTSIFLHADVTDYRQGDLKLDTLNFDIRQRGQRLDYVATVNNKPGTFDRWAHVNVDGYFETGKLGINLRQRDIKDDEGFNIGAMLKFNPDTTMTLHFDPLHPTINYRQWTLNDNNFIKYDFKHKHLDANVRLKSDVSSMALYTEHADESDIAAHGADEDLVLQLFDIQLQDWIAINPFAPPVKGNLSAGIRINRQDNYLRGNGTVALTDLVYGRETVGDLRADVDLMTSRDGLLRMSSDLWVNGEKTATVAGALNDSTKTSPFNLDFRMIHFPLATANAFLPGVARLGGTLNGVMDIGGDASNPVVNGYLAFDKAKVNVNMLGSTLSIAEDTIPIKDNLVTFNDFKIRGVNDNPLRVNGTVDIAMPSNPDINLKLNADNMQIVNTKRPPKGADIYGTAFIGLNSKVIGNFDMLNVNAKIDVLPGTNVTYVMADGAAAIENRANGDIVKFVNFNDTAAVAQADSLFVDGTILNLNAILNVRNGTTINVGLGANAQDRISIEGSGQLNYVSSPVGDGRMTGRYNLSGGFLKYSPPLISNLDFKFQEGSYVAFSGAMDNPQLNITAIERMRANVSQAGRDSRLIYFDVILNVKGTMSNMDVSFDLATDDDITVANELASMSATQRASEAMNLLLYNTYTGGSTKATTSINGNPLFSFLTGQVNSWLANNVSGVDISLGVDQYDRTLDGSMSTTTSYSYRVSKSLFNDRFKIVVGGSYSDDDTQNASVASNLVNDISFEYYLNNARTMYVQLFRHTGFISILEGEITQTGVGFVYRRKIDRISDMFIPSRMRRKEIDNPQTSQPQQAKKNNEQEPDK